MIFFDKLEYFSSICWAKVRVRPLKERFWRFDIEKLDRRFELCPPTSRSSNMWNAVNWAKVRRFCIKTETAKQIGNFANYWIPHVIIVSNRFVYQSFSLIIASANIFKANSICSIQNNFAFSLRTRLFYQIVVPLMLFKCFMLVLWKINLNKKWIGSLDCHPLCDAHSFWSIALVDVFLLEFMRWKCIINQLK